MLHGRKQTKGMLVIKSKPVTLSPTKERGDTDSNDEGPSAVRAARQGSALPKHRLSDLGGGRLNRNSIARTFRRKLCDA